MTPTLRAVIFDVDGTLVDSEQSGHRVAFNEAFAAFGMPDRWDRTTYRELLAVTGGEHRLRSWFADPRSSTDGDDDPGARAADLHAWKTGWFTSMCRTGQIPARPGVGRLLGDLEAHDIDLAIATTGTRAWVDPLIDARFGLDRFDCIVTGDDVAHRKPAPDAYHRVLEILGLRADEALALEDSPPGLAAARSAGIACVVVANEETDHTQLVDAQLVTSGYGGPGAPMEVLSDPFGITRAGTLSAEVLMRLHAACAMQ